MGALIAGWRKAWGQGDFPFIYVQKPSGTGCAFDPADPVTNQVTNVLVKWLEREIRFASVGLQFCSNLALPNNISLPAASGLTDPSAAIGAKPVVTDAPRVIQGDVKF